MLEEIKGISPMEKSQTFIKNCNEIFLNVSE
jgi:hypothetical protein